MPPSPHAADAHTADARALRAIAVQFMLNGIAAAAYIPRLPEIRDQLGIDLSDIGLIITCASIGGLFGSWLCSRLVVRFGTKRLMIVGSMVLIAAIPCVALAQTTTALIAVLALIAFTDVIVDVAMNMQGSALSARRAQPVINRLHGLWSVGSVIGGSLAAAMAAIALPLQYHLLGVSLLMAAALLYIGGGLLDKDRPEPQLEDSPAPGTSHLKYWVFMALGVAALIPEMASSDWSPFRLRDDLGSTEGLASLAYVAFTVGMVIGRMGGDWAAVVLGRQALLSTSVLLSSLGIGLACFIDSPSSAYLGLLVAGVGISVLFPTLYDTAARDRGRPGAALGAMTAGSRISMLAAPLMLGYLASSPALSVGAAMALLSLPCLLLVWLLSQRLYKH